jgi:hypothetical protein
MFSTKEQIGSTTGRKNTKAMRLAKMKNVLSPRWPPKVCLLRNMDVTVVTILYVTKLQAY